MQQSTARYFIVGAIRETILTLTPKQVLTQQEIHGANLRLIRGDGESQPAAAGITKPTMGQSELPPIRKPKAEKVGTGRSQNRSKPLIDETTGKFYTSARIAGVDLDISPSRISEQLVGKTKRQTINGHIFREAKAHEIKAGVDIAPTKPFVEVPRKNRPLKPGVEGSGRPIICITTSTYYPSSHRASKEMDIAKSAILNCVNGKIEQVRGYTFREATLDEYKAKGFIPAPAQ